MMLRGTLIGIVLAVVGLAPLLSSAGEAPPSREYLIKAAFIYNIARYVEWPLAGLQGNTASLCVIGEDRFGDALDGLAGRFVHGRKLQPKRITDLAEIPDCDILFIDRGESDRLPDVCAVAEEHNTLTVSDSPGFAQRCVMVNLVPRGSRIGFEVNRRSVAGGRLRLSSELLRLAEIVRDEGDPAEGSD